MEDYDNKQHELDGETISFLTLDNAPAATRLVNAVTTGGGGDDDDDTDDEGSGRLSIPRAPAPAYPAAAVRHIVGVTLGMAMGNAALNAVLVLYVNDYFGVDEDGSTAITSAWNIVIWSAAPIAGIVADRHTGSYSTQRWAFVFWVVSALASLTTTVPEVAKYFDTSSPLAMSPDTIPLLSFAIIGATGQAIGFGIVNTLLPMFLGDQFSESRQASERSRAFVILYFAYNVGTLIGETVAPVLRQDQSYLVCFIFVLGAVWFGLVSYVSGSQAYRKVARFASPSEGLLSSLRRDFLSVQRIALLYVALMMFWALYVQLNSTFVLQAKAMDRTMLGYKVPPDVIPAIEDVGVLLAIVLVDRVVDPVLVRCRIRVTPLRKISAGLMFSTMSFVVAAVVQLAIDHAHPIPLSVWWQVPQILLMSLAETLVVISGLQFGFAASPSSARPVVFALWSLSTALGATVVVSSAKLLGTNTVTWYASYAAAMFASACLFIFLARRFH